MQQVKNVTQTTSNQKPVAKAEPKPVEAKATEKKVAAKPRKTKAERDLEKVKEKIEKYSKRNSDILELLKGVKEGKIKDKTLEEVQKDAAKYSLKFKQYVEVEKEVKNGKSFAQAKKEVRAKLAPKAPEKAQEQVKAAANA